MQSPYSTDCWYTLTFSERFWSRTPYESWAPNPLPPLENQWSSSESLASTLLILHTASLSSQNWAAKVRPHWGEFVFLQTVNWRKNNLLHLPRHIGMFSTLVRLAGSSSPWISSLHCRSPGCSLPPGTRQLLTSVMTTWAGTCSVLAAALQSLFVHWRRRTWY